MTVGTGLIGGAGVSALGIASDSVGGAGMQDLLTTGSVAVPIIVDHTETLTSSSTSPVFNVPAGTVDGHLLVMLVAANQNTSLVPPAGWTQIVLQTANPAAMQLGAWYRVAASEPASYTWTGAINSSVGYMLSISGADTDAIDTPNVSAVNAPSGTQSTIDAPSVTTTEPGALILMFVGADSALSSNTITESGNLTLLDTGGVGSTLQAVIGNISTKEQASPGVVSAETFTLSSADECVATTIAIAAPN